MARPAHGRWSALAGATALLGGLLGAASDAAQGANPVQAQALRKARLDAQALAAIRERTRALVESLQQEPLAPGRGAEGSVQALRGDALYLRPGPARDPLLVPLTLQPSARVLGRPSVLLRPAGAAARLQLREGESVRARSTVSPLGPQQPAPPPAPR